MPLEHILINLFLKKIYWNLKKLSKLFKISIKLFPKIVYYYALLRDKLVKSIYIYIYSNKEFIINVYRRILINHFKKSFIKKGKVINQTLIIIINEKKNVLNGKFLDILGVWKNGVSFLSHS